MLYKLLKNKRRWILTPLILMLMVALMLGYFLGPRVEIESGGMLSIGTNIALAANSGIMSNAKISPLSPGPDEITYYWDEYDSSPLTWTSESGAFDGSLEYAANTASDGYYLQGTATTCPGDDLGTITKVEIRCYGYGDGDDRIDISFNSVDTGPTTPEYQITMPPLPKDWSSYVDVTNDSNVNGWTWAKIANLYSESSLVLVAEYDKSGKGDTMRCFMIQIRVTYGLTPDISNVGGDWGLGVVEENSTYWANGSEPTWPLTDPDAKWTVTNNSGASIDIYIKGTNFTGGTPGWTLSGTPGEDQVVLVAFKEGDGSGDGKTLTLNDQLFIDSLGDGADMDWEMKFLSATSHSNGDLKTATVTITAQLE